MSAGKIPVTVAIPVKDEEQNLQKCLPRLASFQEVFVIDSGSKDRTREIASAYGATIVDFRWNGKFPKKRNWFLQNCNFNTEWILFLDADEVLDDDVCVEMANAIADTTKVGFWLNYTNHFMGRRLRHGLPQRKLALIRRGAGQYEQIEEDNWSSLDMEVHEHPVLEGEVGEIVARIDHDDDRGLARFIERHRQYAVWEAHRYASLHKAEGGTLSSMTDRQRFKYRNLPRAWYSPLYFLYTYVVRLGLMDGREGLFYALLKAWYFLLIRLLILEMRAKQ